jgi:hypothetical protein
MPNAAGSIAENILAQMAQRGQPKTTTTTVTEPDESVNVGELGLLAMLLSQDNTYKPTTVGLGETPMPAARDVSGLVDQAPGFLEDRTGPDLGTGLSGLMNLNNLAPNTMTPASGSVTPNIGALTPDQIMALFRG